MTRCLTRCAAVAMVALAITQSALAHFVWIETQPQAAELLVRAGFGESDKWDAHLADNIKQTKYWTRDMAGTVKPVELKFAEKSGEYRGTAAGKDFSAVLGFCDYGVVARGKEPFYLQYSAKNLVGAPATWLDAKPSDVVRIEVLAVLEADGVRFTTYHLGKPLAGATFKAWTPADEKVELTTDDKGVCKLSLAGPGYYKCLVNGVVNEAGEVDGKKFATKKDYATLGFSLAPADVGNVASSLLPNLPEKITSFGGVLDGGYLYAYAGHIGGSHEHSRENLSKGFRRLSLADPKQWEELPSGTPLQGLPLVAYKGKIIRVGGVHAMNAPGEPDQMESVAEVESYDPAAKKWTKLASLPEARSSHDAVVIGDHLYVVGGWNMQYQDGKETQWHKKSLRLDLSKSDATWEELPEQPFVRRALAAAAANGKVYVVGGLQEKGGISTEVDVYDPQTKVWTKVDALPSGPMQGFGMGAIGVDNRLIVSTNAGVIYRLKGANWVECGKLATPRFLHRLVATSPTKLIAFGGSARSGHLDNVEAVTISE